YQIVTIQDFIDSIKKLTNPSIPEYKKKFHYIDDNISKFDLIFLSQHNLTALKNYKPKLYNGIMAHVSHIKFNEMKNIETVTFVVYNKEGREKIDQELLHYKETFSMYHNNIDKVSTINGLDQQMLELKDIKMELRKFKKKLRKNNLQTIKDYEYLTLTFKKLSKKISQIKPISNMSNKMSNKISENLQPLLDEKQNSGTLKCPNV
ncbi:hypothetical protein A3Q56_08690, partial [Intoshia linei]